MLVDVIRVKAQMAYRGIDSKGLAEQMGISYTTLLYKFKNPAKFKIGEVQRMADLIGIEDVREIVFR